MTVKELIEALSKYPEDTQVWAWDYDESEYAKITGLEWEIEGSWIYVRTDQ